MPINKKKYYQSFEETIMNMKPIIVRNIALMVVFGVIALTMFTENVRTVQIVGLLACGAVFGAALTAIIFALKSKQTKA
jgi:site-specific recombinase